MNTAFEDCFGSYLSAAADYRLYQQAKGYREEGYSAYWEPQDPCELQAIEPSHGPGAMTVGELDDYDGSDAEEF